MSDESSRTFISRRGLLVASAAMGAGFAVPSLAQTKDQIVYASWGGSWEAAMRKAWFDPFAASTGIKVNTVGGNTVGRLQAMVRARNTEWDVMEGVAVLARIGAKEGLLEPIDFSIVNRSQSMVKSDLFTDYSVPQLQSGRVMVYNKKFADAPPESWHALWDLKRFPGKRTLYKSVGAGVLEVALIADGVTLEKLYPLDVDRALAKLGQIREHILWYDTPAQGEQYFSSEQVVLGLLADGRAYNVVNQGFPIRVQPNMPVMEISVLVVPKGARNKDAAMKFLAYALSPPAQAAIAMAYTYGPVTSAAWDLLPKDRASTLSGAPERSKTTIYLNTDYWAENLDKVNEKFQAWLLG